MQREYKMLPEEQILDKIRTYRVGLDKIQGEEPDARAAEVATDILYKKRSYVNDSIRIDFNIPWDLYAVMEYLQFEGPSYLSLVDFLLNNENLVSVIKRELHKTENVYTMAGKLYFIDALHSFQFDNISFNKPPAYLWAGTGMQEPGLFAEDGSWVENGIPTTPGAVPVLKAIESLAETSEVAPALGRIKSAIYKEGSSMTERYMTVREIILEQFL